MTSFITDLLSTYDFLINKSSDALVKDWPLTDSPFPILLIIASYLYFVLGCGPRYMQRRRPYNLKRAIALYNVCQVAACTLLSYKMIVLAWTTGDRFKLGCQADIYVADPNHVEVPAIIWWVFILKLTELTETVFFVLRKKQSQVSVLHVYHHSSTLVIAWLSSKYFVGRAGIIISLLNCIVHILMYTYYLLALLGPDVQKRIYPWKKCLTLLQIIQLLSFVIYSATALRSECSVVLFMGSIFCVIIFFDIFLFVKFYVSTYMGKRNKAA